jgi:ubiquinone/menaquinone biosynthesis C-methylase UbiE
MNPPTASEPMQRQPIKTSSAPAVSLEEARIRTAYAKREEDARYSWFNAGFLFEMQERERGVLASLKRQGIGSLTTKNILEIGCGAGYWPREFIKWGAQPANISGIELLPDLVATAHQLCPGSVKIYCGNAAQLPFADATFDLVLQSTVFTSILDGSMKQQIAAEMLRVAKRDGLIFWYDFHANNPWNRDVRGIRRHEIHRLFPGCQIQLRRLTLAPPLVRFLAPYSWMVCYLLGKIPWLCTHYLGVIQKREMVAGAIPPIPCPGNQR